MKILIQMGNKSNSVVDHLIRPLARIEAAERILVVARRPGPDIPKTEYHTPPKATVGIPPLAVLFEFLKLLSISISERPHCVIGQKLFPHALMAFVTAKVTGRAIIMSIIAGPVELFSTGSPAGVDFGKPLPLKGRLFLRLLRQSDAVVTTGSFTKEFLVRHGVPADRVHAVIHTPSPSQYHPEDVRKEYDVVSVGRLVPVKNIETLLRAISRAKEKKGDIRVCVVGDGPCREKLIALAANLGISENVEFVGFQKEVASYYNKARVFVLTSEREGFPNVLLEAMMSGLPSVVTDCGDVQDVTIDGYNSIIVRRYNDHEGIADAITRLLEDDALRSRLAMNALMTVEDFSIVRATNEWNEILNGTC